MSAIIESIAASGRDLVTHPPSEGERVFLVPEGVPIPGGGGERPARILHVAHLVSTLPFDKDRDFVSIHGGRIKELISSAAWMSAKEHWDPFWEIDHNFIPDKQSKGRRWARQYRNAPCEKIIVPCPRLCLRLEVARKRAESGYGATEWGLMQDLGRTTTMIDDIPQHLANLPSKDSVRSQFHREAAHEDAINQIQWQDFGAITRDPFGKRMHHFYSNCPKEVRRSIVVDDAHRVIELDLSNSQPYFLAVVFNHIDPLVEAAVAGEFYETVNAHLPDPLDMGDKEQRDQVKRTCLMLIYRRPHNGFIWWRREENWHGKVMGAMESAYPGIDAALDDYSRTNGGDLALVSTLQRMESTVFIDRILPECQRLGLWAAPVHDCILTTTNEEPAVRSLMEKELEKFTRIPPTIKRT